MTDEQLLRARVMSVPTPTDSALRAVQIIGIDHGYVRDRYPRGSMYHLRFRYLVFINGDRTYAKSNFPLRSDSGSRVVLEALDIEIFIRWPTIHL